MTGFEETLFAQNKVFLMRIIFPEHTGYRMCCPLCGGLHTYTHVQFREPILFRKYFVSSKERMLQHKV